MRGTLLMALLLTACVPELPSGPPASNTTPDANEQVTPPPPPPPDAPPPIDPKEVLKVWSGCMSLANFQTANMATGWGNLSGNGQQCSNCHGNGGFGMIATLNEAVFFKTITEQSSYMLKFFSVDTVNGTVIINNNSFQNANTNIVGHPHFDPLVNAGMVALKKFFDSTTARKLAATCDPPRLVN